MRYLNSAAFLLLMISSSISLRSQAAIAAPETLTSQSNPLPAALPETRPETRPKADTPQPLQQPRLSSLLRVSEVRSPQFSDLVSQGLTLEDLRNSVDAAADESSSAAEQDLAQSTDTLPVLEDAPADSTPVEPVEEAIEGESIEEELIEDPSLPAGLAPALDVEINELPDALRADPNPLSVPSDPAAVELDQNSVITLEQAIELAYLNNQTLQAALLSLEQAGAAVREAEAARLPTVSVGADLTNTQGGSTSQTVLGANLQVDYSLLTGGSRQASIRAAELQQDVSALAVEAQQEQIRLVTANLYYALQEAGEQIRINQSFLDEAERNLRDSQLRQEVGVGTQFDVLRAEVQFANARQSLIQSQGDQQIARRDIARLLNLPPTAGIEATPVAVAKNWPLTLEESIILAFQNRAELEQQLNQADISEQQRQIALAAIRPQVGLFARYNAQSLLEGGSAFQDDFQDNYTFGAQFSMQLFDGGAARASARAQELSAAIAEEQFSENLDQFRFDVEQAFFNLQSNQENIATSRIAVSQAQDALELANLRLQAGVDTQLSVLQAQRELTEAEVNNVTAILGYNRALAAMERAVSNVSFNDL
ncbi:MAG: TolC family protein [Phormidesmis sp.]